MIYIKYKMLINQIITETKTTMLYHGTSSVFLPQIMKHGLQPNLEHHSWITGGEGGESYGGVYLTADQWTAENAATAACNTHGGDPVVLKVQYALGSGSLDEDEIVDTIIGGAKWAVVNNDYSSLMKEVLQSISGKPTRVTGTYLSQLFSKLFQLFKRSKFLRDDWQIEDKARANPEIRELIRKVMESVKVVDMEKSTNVRVTRPIKFKGKTRIIGVVR